MKPVLSVDFTRKLVVVTTETAVYVFKTRSEAFEAFPLLRPEPPVVDRRAERRAERRERSERVQGGVGFSRSGRR